ncbi:hypothetical protein VTI74DRAFT_1084 [Chaetomium olivicolor]
MPAETDSLSLGSHSFVNEQTTAQKRPAEGDENAGQHGLAHTGQAPEQTAPREPRSQPVFKMKRTGHRSPFPLSGRPGLQSNLLNGSRSPSVSSPAALSPSGSHDTRLSFSSDRSNTVLEGTAVSPPAGTRNQKDSVAAPSLVNEPARDGTLQRNQLR